MQAFLCDEAGGALFVSLPPEDRASFLKPMPTPDLATLLQKLHQFIVHNPSPVAAKARDLFLDLLGPSPLPLGDALSVTLVVIDLGFGEDSDCAGRYFRVSGSEQYYMLLSRALWAYWRDALYAGSLKDRHGLELVLVASLVHELAHHCVSLGAQHAQLRTQGEVSAEKHRVPWLPDPEAESGYYAEWKVFGGLLGWDPHSRHVRIRVGVAEERILTADMVSRGLEEVLLDYVEEYSLLNANAISPPPSTPSAISVVHHRVASTTAHRGCVRTDLGGYGQVTEADFDYYRQILAEESEREQQPESYGSAPLDG
ncbi:hypothetical protein C8R46DRAFT_1122243 [Mycena filopes]|nr:hypothetical protein C8R46DRAFT_1122243 [Mycena filopes]